MDEKDRKIKELKEIIRLLSEENASLSERAEDVSLVSLISSNLLFLNDKEKIITQVLEQICVLKNIYYAAFGLLDGKFIQIQDDYSYFADERVLQLIEITDEIRSQLTNNDFFYGNTNEIFVQESLRNSAVKLIDKQCVIIKRSVFTNENLFLFIFDAVEEDYIKITVPLLKQVLNIVTIRIENLDLLEQLKSSSKKYYSEWKQGKDDLMRITRNFETLINSSPDGVVLHSAGKIVFANSSLAKMFGYPEPKELKGKDIFSFIHPEERPFAIERSEKIAKGQAQGFKEYRMLKADGTYKYIEAAGVPIYNEVGVTVFTTIRDIENRKIIEKDLLQQKKFLTDVMDSITNPLYVIDANTYEIVHANTASGFKEITKGTKCYEATHNTDKPCGTKEHPCPLEEIKNGKTNVVLEHVHHGWDGKKKYFEVHGYPIYDNDGNLVQIIEYSLDITLRKEYQKDLIKFRLGLEYLEEIVFTTDLDGKINFVNPAFEKYYGIKAEDIVGKNPRVLKSAEHSNDFNEKLWDTLLHQKSFKGIIINKDKNGNSIHLDSTISPILNRNKEAIGYIAVQRDITDKVKSREALKFAKEKAEAADKLKSEFLAQVSHEIRTPLNVLMNYAFLIKDGIPKEYSKELDFAFEAINKSGNRIIRTVDLILNMNELNLGTYNPNLQKFSITDEVLKKLFDEYSPEADKKNLSFSLIKNTDDDDVVGDEYSITQIFANLIDNAIKFTEKGFVKIVVNKTERGIKVVVSDSGLGIDKEYLPDIFSPFSQEERGYTRKFDGSGLGMAVVKKYCDLNKVEISIQSEKGKGTSVVTLFTNTSFRF